MTNRISYSTGFYFRFINNSKPLYLRKTGSNSFTEGVIDPQQSPKGYHAQGGVFPVNTSSVLYDHEYVRGEKMAIRSMSVRFYGNTNCNAITRTDGLGNAFLILF